MRIIKIFVILAIFSIQLSAQSSTLTQTIRGIVIEEGTELPIPGAALGIVGNSEDSHTGTMSDSEGNFILENVPVGRTSIQCSMIGYEKRVLVNLYLTSGKTLYVRVVMKPSTHQLKEITVTAQYDKTATLNKMATVSARMFSIEESERYAGSLGDPARMAQNFAGVFSGGNDGRNDIIIRGNSPTGLLWRLEGVEIPNPNHYSSPGSNGGTVSMINTNLLSNSDFLTGAFPAEYGNATSGVFDLNMREGNPIEHEFLTQLGWNGLELGAEGPLSKKSGATYIVNYRYTFLGILDKLGLGQLPTGGAAPGVPYYQDFTARMHFPLKKLGTLTLVALGGTSSIEIEPNENHSKGDYTSYFTTSGSSQLTTFLKHQIRLGSSTNLISYLSLSYTKSFNELLDRSKNDLLVYDENNTDRYLNTGMRLKHRFSKKSYWESGFSIRWQDFDYVDSILLSSQAQQPYNNYIKQTDDDGNTTLIKAYTQWKYALSKNLELSTGIHGQWLKLNDSWAIEPRIGLSYEMNQKNTFAFGYGIHHQMQTLFYYYIKTTQYNNDRPTGFSQTNINLDFTRSQHYVLSWNTTPFPNLRFKTEIYYQDINQVPITESPSPFSLSNTGHEFNQSRTDSLVNKGLQYNYGVEFTLEKFLHNGWYFLSTLSLFDSRYKASDNVWRNTAFNNQYIWNLLGGWEYPINEFHHLLIDIKSVLGGGKPYTQLPPAQNGLTIEDFNPDTYLKERTPTYFRLDLRFGYRLNSKGGKMTQEFGLDLQNLTNHFNVLSQSRSTSGELIWIPQTGFFPLMTYRITF